uniref:Uncharacterized protein TCIL3000_4_3240 n=1 Tax=Trypanosoma congolense (strain IL3000) TaxID=1068625 RepID=G0ULH4_TRYCI|nr:unnamed protein product [Trypanosoma congolense IL3000]
MSMTFPNITNREPLTLQVGEVVAYDYLLNGEHWQWSLGTLMALDRHVATVEQWSINEGNCEALKCNISNEIQKEMKRMGSFQEQLSAARDKLAAIRSENEDRVSAARAVFEEAKLRVASVDEVHMREVTSQACPSPVAVEVLKSVLALAQNDPLVTNYSTWDDIRMEYRRPNAVMEFINTDISGRTYPNSEDIYVSLNEQRLSSQAASRDSEAISALHQWILSALAYQEAHCRLTTDTRIQDQNDAISNSIVGMKGCRLKVMKLKEELERGGTPTFGDQLTSFTRTSVQVKTPLSAIISVVNVEPSARCCVMTNDEVELIAIKAEQTRFQISDQHSHVFNSYMEAMAELHCLSMYTNELEEKRLNLQERFMFSLLSSEKPAGSQRHEVVRDVPKRSTAGDPKGVGVDIKELQEIIKELKNHDERWSYQSGSTITTKHRKSYQGKDWCRVVERKPEELLAKFKAEQALACRVPEDAIKNVEFNVTSDSLQVVFDVQHPAKQTSAEINNRLQSFPAREMERLHQGVDKPKTGLDRAIVEVCRAFDLREDAFRGMAFDKFIEEVSVKGRVGDKDAYESEIGDLLMLLDKINSENRSLQYTLEKSAEEFRRQTASTMREQEALRQRNDELNAEIGRLRDLVEKLRDLADNQASELEVLKLQKNQAIQIRAQRDLSTFKGDDSAEPVYCVTLDELHEQMDHCDKVERELSRQREQLQNLLNAHDNLVAELSSTTEEKEKLEAECEQLEDKLRQMEDRVGALEGELVTANQRLEEKQAEVNDLLNKLERLDNQMDALRAAEKSARDHIEARDREIFDLQRRLESEIDEHIKTTATLEDLRKRCAGMEELLEQQDAELAAYRERRLNAHKLRSLEPTLQPIIPQVKAIADPISLAEIANEPLLSVTLDEYSDHRQRASQLQQEIDSLRQQLQQPSDERDNLHDRLEQLMAENQNLGEQLHSALENLEREEKEKNAIILQNERLADEVEQKSAENQRLAEELEQKSAENEKLAEELEQKSAENEKLAEELEQKSAENEKLAEELEQKSAENERLAEELEQKSAENEKLAEELEQKSAENQRLAEELEQKSAENERLAEELEQKSAENEKLAEELEQKSAENQRLAEELEQKSAENERLAEELEQKSAENEKLAEELEQKSAENERLAEELEQKSAENEKLAEELEQKSAENERLAEELEQKSAENEKLAEELEQKSAENEKLAEELEQKSAENEKLAEELEQKSAENEKLAEELEQKSAENERLAEELEQKSAENEKLAEELEQKSAENEKLAEELEQKSAENEKLAEELEQKSAENEKLAEELEQKSAENEKLAEELEQKSAENQRLAEELEQKSAENEKLAEELEQKSAENERLAEELEQKSAENEKLAEELEQKSAENEKLAKQLMECIAEKDSFAEEARAKLQEANSVSDALRMKLKHLEEEMSDLLSDKEAALATLESEIVDLLTELKGLTGINTALGLLCASKDKELGFLRDHCELWTDPTEKRERVVSRHVKVFDGNEWMKLLDDRPEALMAAFVIDAGNACHVPGDQIGDVSFCNRKE